MNVCRWGIAFVLVSAFTVGPACAARDVWHSSSKKDEFSNETTYSAFGFAGYDYKSESGKPIFMSFTDYSFGVRCDVSENGSKDFMLTFKVEDALATPNSNARVFVKVDENKPIELVGRLYTDSYRSGFVRLSTGNRGKVESFISQAIAGNKMTVRVHDERKSNIEDFPVLLRGFTKHTAATLQACDISPDLRSISDADKARIEEIEREIKRLEAERDGILSRY